MRIFIFLFLASLVVSSILMTYGCSEERRQVIGVKIYEYNNDPDSLVTIWQDMGINTAFISKELVLNGNFRKALIDNHFPFYIIWPVFQNPEALKNDSSLFAITDQGLKAKDGWVEFVCPSRVTYRQMQLDSIIWYIQNFKPDGISLDFIRQFVFWEMIYPGRDPSMIDNACYCDSCLRHFTAQYAFQFSDSLKTIRQKSTFLTKNYKAEWNRYRCEQITSLIRDISGNIKRINPSIKINVHIVPWRDPDFDGANIKVAGQDIQGMEKYVDYVSPMCYSQMLRRNSSWISSVVEELDRKARGKVIPSIQVFPYYIDNTFPVDSLKECLVKSLNFPSNGVIFWSWPLLIKDQKRADMVSDYIKNGI